MARSRGALTPLLSIVVVAAALLGFVIAKDWTPQLGLDLQGGASVVFEPDGEATDDQLDTAIGILRSRVDALGVAEPEIVRQGDSIVVNLPGIEDSERAIEIIGRTAQLEFRPVLAGIDAALLEPSDDSTTTSAPPDGSSTTASTATTATTAPAETTDTTEGALGLAPGENAGALLPRQETTTTTAAPPASSTTTSAPASTTSTTEGEPVDPDDPCGALGGSTDVDEASPEDTVQYPGKPDEDGRVFCYQLGPVRSDGDVSLVGNIVTSPEANIQVGEWGVTLGIRGEALDLFNEQSAECYSGGPGCPTQPGTQSGQMAIVLDGVVQSALGFQVPTFTGDGLRISGNFSEREARDLALVLRYGALPIELERVNFENVSPTLGEESLEAGLTAGLIGIAVVAIYMLLYYRALGVVVLLGMVIWAALLYGVVCYLSAEQGLALTLAGVAGLVVSVGVTVDSYVVFFERLKDEVRSGKTLRSSVDRGFKRAFRTVLAANATSFIGAFLLYVLTVGAVRGFAFMLGLSTILDVVVAWFFARPAVGLLGRSDVVTRHRWWGVARGAKPAGTVA